MSASSMPFTPTPIGAGDGQGSWIHLCGGLQPSTDRPLYRWTKLNGFSETRSRRRPNRFPPRYREARCSLYLECEETKDTVAVSMVTFYYGLSM